MNSTGKEIFRTQMFTKKFVSSMNLLNPRISYRKNKTNIQLLNKLKFLRERLNGLLTKSNFNYYEHMANKLNNVQKNSRPYWSLLKCF